jgi:hypothetical protein
MTPDPFPMTGRALFWLAYLAEAYGDTDALSLLWWQASIGPLGINQTSAIRARSTP